MENKPLSEKSTEQLQSELKIHKAISGALGSILAVLVATIIYGLIAVENKTPFIALFAVVLSSGLILGLQVANISKIKKELLVRAHQ